MKKLVYILLILCILYLGIVLIQKQFGNGYTISYMVNTQNEKFEIKEVYHKKTKNQLARYWIQIGVNDTIFPIEMISIQGKKQIVEDVYTFSNDDYVCIYPVGEYLSSLDVLCQKDSTIYSYHTIIGEDSEVDAFVTSLTPFGYDDTTWKDRRSILKSIKGLSIYDNLVPTHAIGMESYKGLYVLDATNLLREKQLFQNDVYQKNIELFYRNYYIIADYNASYEFHEFSVINMKNQKETKIISNKAISFDSYIQGIVEEAVYILDRGNKKQYKIHLSDKTVTKVGDIDSGVQIYKDGKWETKTMYEVLKQDIYFYTHVIPDDISREVYEFVDVTGDYYYGYQSIDGGYAVYRMHKQNPSIRYYITTLKEKKQVSYIDNYIYFMDNGCLYYYHDTTGVRMVVQNPEFNFNPNLQFGVYENEKKQ